MENEGRGKVSGRKNSSKKPESSDNYVKTNKRGITASKEQVFLECSPSGIRS